MTTVDAITRHFGYDRAWVLFKNGLLRILPRGQSLSQDELAASARKSFRTVLSKLETDQRHVDEWQQETVSTTTSSLPVELFYVPHSTELAIAATRGKKTSAADEAQAELDALAEQDFKHWPEAIAFGSSVSTLRTSETKKDYGGESEWTEAVQSHFGPGFYLFPTHHMVVGPVASSAEAVRLLEVDARKAALGLHTVYVHAKRLGYGDLYSWQPFASLGIHVVTLCRDEKLAREKLRECYLTWTTSDAHEKPVCPKAVAAVTTLEIKTSSETLIKAYKVTKRSDPDTNVTVFTHQGKEHAKAVGKEALGCKKVDVECMPTLRLSVVLGAHVISACEEEEGKESESESD